MGPGFFTSDLHGRPDRYEKLLGAVRRDRPAGVFLGGDLLPHFMNESWRDETTDGGFVDGFLAPRFDQLRRDLAADYPRIFLILGNDDLYGFAADLEAGRQSGLWSYLHGRSGTFGRHVVYGYNCVPPTPFQLKDWERYDVSRFTDPGCVSPEEGLRTDGRTVREAGLATISGELEALVGDDDLSDAILLFHCPPHGTRLDRADLEGKFVDHAPLDPHVGSIAIRRLIESKQPLLSLHGHVHESTRLTGAWREELGRTTAFNGAHHGPELALIRFDTDDLGAATRELL